MDENIILKYRREFDCWVCDECDIENEISSDSCIVCSAPKPQYPKFLKAWSPDDEAPPPIPHNEPANHRVNSDFGTEPVFRDASRGIYTPPQPPKDSMSGVLIWLIVFIIIFICLIIYGIYGA